MKIKILIIDDNLRMRNTLTRLVATMPGTEVVGSKPDATTVLEDIAQLQPDLILMDIEMPDISGIEAVKIVKSKFPHIQVLMLTAHDDDDKVFASICNGASGYLLKNTTAERLSEAILEVHEGGSPMSPSIARKVLGMLKNDSKPEASNAFNLTQREKEVLKLLVDGLSYKMIANECKISFETVRSHVKHIYEKLHAVSMADAVSKALRYKLI